MWSKLSSKNIVKEYRLFTTLINNIEVFRCEIYQKSTIEDETDFKLINIIEIDNFNFKGNKCEYSNAKYYNINDDTNDAWNLIANDLHGTIHYDGYLHTWINYSSIKELNFLYHLDKEEPK